MGERWDLRGRETVSETVSLGSLLEVWDPFNQESKIAKFILLRLQINTDNFMKRMRERIRNVDNFLPSIQPFDNSTGVISTDSVSSSTPQGTSTMAQITSAKQGCTAAGSGGQTSSPGSRGQVPPPQGPGGRTAGTGPQNPVPL